MSVQSKILALFEGQNKQIAQEAIELALERHAGQTRGGGEPHADHVLRVGLAAGLWALSNAPEALLSVVLAGILHDTMEDTPTTEEELAARFGGEVARIVRALSHIEEEEPDAIYLGRVAEGGRLAVAVKRHDKLDNLASLSAASPEFQVTKIAETRAALVIWEKIDPEAVALFETEMAKLEKK